jgi:hypothetical protein
MDIFSDDGCTLRVPDRSGQRCGCYTSRQHGGISEDVLDAAYPVVAPFGALRL